MTITEWQKTVDGWIKDYGVRYFDPMTNTLLLSEEVGEFARIISRVYGEQSFKSPLSDSQSKEKLAEELGDIIFVVTCLANQMDIDLTTELSSNIKKKTKRDHVRHKSNPKLSEDK